MFSLAAGGDRYRHLSLLGQNIPEAGLLLSPGDRLHRVQGGRGGRLPHRGAPHPRQAVHQESLDPISCGNKFKCRYLDVGSLAALPRPPNSCPHSNSAQKFSVISMFSKLF